MKHLLSALGPSLLLVAACGGGDGTTANGDGVNTGDAGTELDDDDSADDDSTDNSEDDQIDNSDEDESSADAAVDESDEEMMVELGDDEVDAGTSTEEDGGVSHDGGVATVLPNPAAVLAFADLTNVGNAQVTPYSSNALCSLSLFSNSAVNVTCFDNDGDPTDARFNVVLFGEVRENAGGVKAYALANQPAEAEYTAPAGSAYNPSGEDVTVTRSGPGDYQVSFSGTTITGGNTHVTAYGGSGHCSIDSWGGNNVHVDCFNSSGTQTDSSFLVMAVDDVVEEPAEILAYAYSPDANELSTDLTDSVYAFNSMGLSITGTRSSTGTYGLEFEGISFSGAHLQATAYGATAICNMKSSTGDTANVNCYGPGGTKVDTRYTVIGIR